jgi:hypothetical protein
MDLSFPVFLPHNMSCFFNRHLIEEILSVFPQQTRVSEQI